jgi:methyl-accepting chemotaxis protein
VARAGKSLKVVKFASDITRQKLDAADTFSQIEAIRKSQAVIEFEMDGTFKWANQNFLDAMGFSLEEVKGKHHRIFVEPVERESTAYVEF